MPLSEAEIMRLSTTLVMMVLMVTMTMVMIMAP